MTIPLILSHINKVSNYVWISKFNWEILRFGTRILVEWGRLPRIIHMFFYLTIKRNNKIKMLIKKKYLLVILIILINYKTYDFSHSDHDVL